MGQSTSWSGASQEESASVLIQVVGRIQLRATYRTEVPLSLLIVSWGICLASRGLLHSLTQS